MKIGNKYKGVIYASLLCLVLPCLVYRLSVSDILECYSMLNSQAEQIELLKQASKQAKLPSQIDVTKIERGELLIATLQTVLDNVTVESYTPITEIKSETLSMQTLSIVLSGDFISLVKVIDYIEKRLNFYRLCSVNFDIVKDLSPRTEKLAVSIIIEQITRL